MYVCVYVHMYVCMYICMYVYMYVCMYICTYYYVCVYVLCMYVHMCVCVHVCMFICMYACMYVCTCVCMYICICVYICIYVCMHVCMHYVCVCMYVCMYVHMYVCIVYICMYICIMYVCMNVSICMYVCTYVCVYIYVYICSMCVCMYDNITCLPFVVSWKCTMNFSYKFGFGSLRCRPLAVQSLVWLRMNWTFSAEGQSLQITEHFTLCFPGFRHRVAWNTFMCLKERTPSIFMLVRSLECWHTGFTQGHCPHLRGILDQVTVFSIENLIIIYHTNCMLHHVTQISWLVQF
jgi:hypothetical protein